MESINKDVISIKMLQMMALLNKTYKEFSNQKCYTWAQRTNYYIIVANITLQQTTGDALWDS